MNNLIVSVDGTSGSGKEKISKYISKKFNLYHLDSGILYRRLSYILIKKKIHVTNINQVCKEIKKIQTISYKKHISLRKENIGKITSKIATYPCVRNYINKQQKLAVFSLLKKYRGCVIDGRDIGSKVFKNAKIKLFIKVNREIRAKRRHKQLIEQGEKSIYSRILKDLNLRDKTDIKRKASPLVVPKGAVIIDNSKSFKNTVDQLKKVLKGI